MKNSLGGKVVLVTGATGGIGREICKAFKKEGAYVVGIGRNLDKLHALIDAGYLNMVHQVDLLEDNIELVINDILGTVGCIDILINNAGFFETRPVNDIVVENIHKTFAVNVYGPILFSKGCSQAMKEKGWGRIFNIGSSSAYNGGKQTSLYCASKHALLGFSRSLSDELKPYGIRVCNLSPSSTQTEMGRIPLATSQDYDTFIDPIEVAEMCVFLSFFDGNMEVKEILLNRVHVQ